jgi:hypothetical protein
MCALVIHVPNHAVVNRGAKSFAQVMSSNVGNGYAIFKNDLSKWVKGRKVIVLRKDKDKRRAEGILEKIVNIHKPTAQGIERYDIYINNLKQVEYKPEKLNRFGVGYIGGC